MECWNIGIMAHCGIYGLFFILTHHSTIPFFHYSIFKTKGVRE